MRTLLLALLFAPGCLDNVHINLNGTRTYTDGCYGARYGYVVSFTATLGYPVAV